MGFQPRILHIASHAKANSQTGYHSYVDDQLTQVMMVDFYKNLKNGETKDKALKRAKLKLINKDVSPFFWSAFVLYGDTRSLF